MDGTEVCSTNPPPKPDSVSVCLSLDEIAVFCFPESPQRFWSEKHSRSWGAGHPDFKLDIVSTSSIYVRCMHVCLFFCLDPFGATVR